jgi:hypothetical protein
MSLSSGSVLSYGLTLGTFSCCATAADSRVLTAQQGNDGLPYTRHEHWHSSILSRISGFARPSPSCLFRLSISLAQPPLNR